MSRSLSAVRASGIALGAVLLVALAGVFAITRMAHIAIAGHQGFGAWWVTVGSGALVFACYCLGLVYLLRRLREFSSAEQQFENIFEHNPLPAWVFDAQTLRFLAVNQAAVAEYGYARDEFLAMTILDVRPPEQRAELLDDVARPAHPDYGDAKVWVHQRKNGVPLEVQVHAASIQFHGVQARLVVAENVTTKLAAERELSHRATHRLRTGLWNSHALVQILRDGESGPCRIACVQIGGLDLVEDSLGPVSGENALKAIAARIAELGRRHGTVAHLRDSEFALVMDTPERWATALADLAGMLAEPIEGEDGMHQFDAWIGTADLPADDADPSHVLAMARTAAHAARAEGLRALAYHPAMGEAASRRLVLTARIRHAIEHDRFALVFQPIHRTSDGAMVGLEALLRWPQEDGSLLPPLEFIPLCEDTGLIVPLGRWVMRRAARAAQQLAAAGFDSLPVAVNVSHVQVASSDFAAEVASLFEEFGLARGALHIELTESVLMTRPEQAMEVLQHLHRQGVCISLDDFGTGFSNMSYLQQLPIDALKIDRSFVQDLERDERNASICRALIALGHGLGLQVVAEGVEDPGQFDWLKRHGCDQAQGFGLGLPVPLEQVLAGPGEGNAGAA